MSAAKTLFLLITFVLIMGCEKGRKEALEAYVKDVKSRTIGQVEPLPDIKPYETFSYNAYDLRSPFEPPHKEQALLSIKNDNGIHPDLSRRKEALEAFALDALKMVGTLEKDNKMWAIIVDKDGTVHRVTAGNYVGQNYGKITKITEEKLTVDEIVPDGSGGWRKQNAEMVLVE